MIQIDHLTYAYPNAAPIFHRFDWEVRRGEAWAVLGPSGCGKTTLLYLLAGLRKSASGSISIDGQTIHRPRPQTGLILQDYGLLPWATARQNVELGPQVRGFYGPDGTHAPAAPVQHGPQQIDSWMNRLGIAPLAGRYPAQLSGGQRQRTAIARTLALQPDLLLMDEPFSSLDAPTRESLQELTLTLQAEQRLTLIIVTHAIEEAAILGRKVLLLNQPPNSEAFVFDNPDADGAGYRHSAAYQDLCRELRARMREA
jgi:NitT/TauT family transport system ATP-binding protein